MGWFEGACDRVVGVAARTLQDRVAQHLDRHTEELLIAAAGMWQHGGWPRFDDDEANCTVQMYGYSRACIRNNPRFTLISVHLEWIDVTPEILQGKQSAKTAKRPDMRIEAGTAGRTIECKRIAATGSWPRRYVHDGLARFVTGSYGHDETTGFMIGYVTDGRLPRLPHLSHLVSRINHYIRRHSNMGSGQQITATHHSPPTLVGVSRHSRSSQPNLSPIDTSHLLIDLDS